MAKYRRIQEVIEAVRFEFERWLYERKAAYPMVTCGSGLDSGFGIHGIYPYIDTLEGQKIVSSGDYIIQGESGEFYISKPDEFEQTYELVDEEAPQ